MKQINIGKNIIAIATFKGVNFEKYSWIEIPKKTKINTIVISMR